MFCGTLFSRKCRETISVALSGTYQRNVQFQSETVVGERHSGKINGAAGNSEREQLKRSISLVTTIHIK